MGGNRSRECNGNGEDIFIGGIVRTEKYGREGRTW